MAASVNANMHVVVASFGSDGDVNPLLAIAGALGACLTNVDQTKDFHHGGTETRRAQC
jgi:hypothetical protein